MKEDKPLNPRLFTLDCSMALHQRLCWLICALGAVAGALAILRFIPSHLSVYFTIALAILLMLIYQWMAQAPMRALTGWLQLFSEDEVSPEEALDFLLKMEKGLSALKRKEMAFQIVCAKGVLLYESGKEKDAITLLLDFDQTWDQSQKDQINELVSDMLDEIGNSILGEGEEE